MLEELCTCLQRYFSHIRQRRSLGVCAAGLLVVRGCTAMQTVGTDSQLGCQDRKAPRKGDRTQLRPHQRCSACHSGLLR